MEADPAKPGVKPPTTIIPNLDPANGQPRFGFLRGRPVQGTENEFEVLSVQPGEYWLRVSASGWVIKSVSWQGRDYTFTPINTASSSELTGLVVTMTNAVPTLTGAVRMPDASTPETAIVVAFPASPALRVNTGFSPVRLRSITMQANGSFSFTTLPAGEYFVAAIDRSRLSTWRDSDYLLTLERQATRVTLAWGQTSSQTLTMVAR